MGNTSFYLRLVMVVLALGMGVFVYRQFQGLQTRNRAAAEMAAEAENPALAPPAAGNARPAAPAGPYAEIESRRAAGDHAAAVGMATRLAAEGETIGIRRKALGLLPGLLMGQFRQALGANDLDTAEAPLSRLAVDFPESAEASWAYNEWSGALFTALNTARRAGDSAKADEFFHRFQAKAPPAYRPHDSNAANFYKYAFERWRELGAGGNSQAGLEMFQAGARMAAARAGSREAAGLLRREFPDDAAREACARQLLERGFAEGALLLAILKPLGAELQTAVRAAATQIATRVLEEPDAGMPAEAAYNLLAASLDAGDRPGAAEAKAMELRPLLLERAGDSHFAARRFTQARFAYQRSLDETRQLWQFRTEILGADPFTGLDAEFLAEFEQYFPACYFDPAARRSELNRRLQADVAALPGTRSARNKVIDAEVGAALKALELRQPNALDALRPFLREHAEDIRGRVRTALEDEIRLAREKLDFNSLQELAGFYVAEVGAGHGNPFRPEIKDSLIAAGEHFNNSDGRLKRYFLQTLTAELFPDDPAGRQARTDAIATGLAIIAETPKAAPKPGTGIPSGLAGLSVVKIDNSTGNHLIIFFDGAERFFVRINPYRRASLVLKDGLYAVGVVVTDPEILPYHGERDCRGEFFFDNYVIRTVGGGQRETLHQSSGATSGPYRLARVPEGVEAASVAEVAEGAAGTGRSANPGLEDLVSQAASADTFKAAEALRELRKFRHEAAAFEAIKAAGLGPRAWQLRQEALAALIPFRGKFDAWAVWCAALQADDFQVAQAALRLVAAFDGPGKNEVLARLANGGSDQMRSFFAKLAGDGKIRLEPRESLEKLLIGIETGNAAAPVRNAALEALCTLGSKYPLGVLKTRLASQDKNERRRAVGLAYRLKAHAAARQLLLQALATEKEVRYDMTLALGNWNTPDVAAHYRQALKSKPSTEHYAVMVGLVKWESPAPDPELPRALLEYAAAGGHPNAREYAVRILCKWEDKAVLPVLAAILGKTADPLRKKLPECLGMFAARPEVQALFAPYRNDPEIGSKVAAALDKPAPISYR